MYRDRFLAFVAAMATATAAVGQPGTFTELGAHTGTEVFSVPVALTAANDIQWFRIELPGNASNDGWVDIWTNAPGDITDSEIGLYDNAGNIVNGLTGGSDDDSGSGLYSQLTYGQTTPARPAIGTGLPRNGIDGVLAGGIYWVAVGRFNVTWGTTGWTASSAYTGTQRTVTLNFDIQPPGAPTNPSGTGTATPNNGLAGASFVATVTVTPGLNPPSTGLAVSLDANAVGGGTVGLLDDGNPPDATAGDNVFTGDVTTSGSATPGPYSLPFTITDAELRSGGGNIAYTVNPPPPANDDCGTAAPVGLGSTPFDSTSATNDGLVVCVASSRDIWFSYTATADITLDIDTCDTSTTFDTVLAVFDACGGTQLDCDDDACVTPSLASIVEGISVSSGSTIYIRVARFSATATAGGPGLLTLTEVVPPDWHETLDGGGDAGQTPGSVQTVSGSGPLDDIAGSIAAAGDADVFEIEICELSLFSASTLGGDTTIDTQLWLFDPVSGLGVTFNDDDPGQSGLQSIITNTFVTTGGTYYLGISTYDNDAVDGSGGALWADTPFDVERAPDGPAAGNPWADFAGSGATGSYRILLTGVCFVGGGDPCPCDGDLDNSGHVTIADLALFLSSFGSAAPGIPTPCADIDGSGTVDLSDLAIILSLFGSPCP